MSVRRVRTALAAALGPGAQVAHRPNHAGAGKLSFSVRTGEQRLWAKVAVDQAHAAQLRTWAELAPLLTERHAAPRLLDVLDLDGRPALLFDLVDAPPASRSTLRRRHDEAADVLEGLHSDRELAERLGEPTTSSACFRAVWLERFEADLAVIEGYVAKDLHAYLTEQVEVLGELVAPLHDEVHSAVHGDPWHENFLADADRLWLLDWDGLRIGDPVLDDAILLNDALGSDPQHWPGAPAYAAARRALMLDAVIDVAADWVESTDRLVRRGKKASYSAALDTYRDEFR